MQRWIIVAAALALVLISVPSAWTAETPLQAGFAETDVSPTVGGKKAVYIAGFGHDRKATALHDPIMARAVVLAHEKQKIALVCVDVVGLFLPTVENVRAELPGFAYVLVSSTHNHEGPDTLGLWGSNPFVSGADPEYLKKVETGIVKAVKDAEAALKPVTAKIGTVGSTRTRPTTLPRYIDAISPQTKSLCSTNNNGPGFNPHTIKPPSRMAAVPEPGIPSASIGSSAAVPDACAAVSGANTPSMRPLPNESLSLEKRLARL